MRNLKLLEGIWAGDVMNAEVGRGREISKLLELMLPLKTVCLSAKWGVSRSCAVSEATELLPDVSLGDVLVEELSADVPYGALVVIVKESLDLAAEPSICFELGAIIGDLLLDVIGSGSFPIENEAEALFIMANLYSNMVCSTELKAQNVCLRSFNNGLAISLNDYWGGDVSSLLASSESDNFRVTDGTLLGHSVAKKYSNIMQCCCQKYKHNDWMKRIVANVMNEIRTSSANVYNH